MGIVTTGSLIHRCSQCESVMVEYITRQQSIRTLSVVRCRNCGHERVLATNTPPAKDWGAIYTNTPPYDTDIYEDF